LEDAEAFYADFLTFGDALCNAGDVRFDYFSNDTFWES
jgi:hypothetical protein